MRPHGGGPVSQNEHDYWPNTLYDTREAQTRDGLNNTDLTLSGVMHYVELDVNNLRQWLAGAFVAAPFGAPNGPNAKNDNGYIVYFSDRRNNKNAAGVETGEYGFEDVTNPTAAGGVANGMMDGGALCVSGTCCRRADGLPRGLQRQPHARRLWSSCSTTRSPAPPGPPTSRLRAWPDFRIRCVTRRS